MKKLLGTLLLISAASITPSTFAGGDACVAGTCFFPSLIASNKHVNFYCDVKGEVSKVRLTDHNVVVQGFIIGGDDAGTLTLEGRRVKDLKSYYFVVSQDNNHISLVKTVTVDEPTDGTVRCHIGTGGRKYAYKG